MQGLLALLAGIIFGLGLIISGMTNPQKVQNFLDIFGNWDPSLIFVMVGAIAVTSIGFLILRQAARPLFAQLFQWPGATAIEPSLITGAIIFGIGWGLIGLCPGPAITSVLLLNEVALIFLPTMVLGMWIGRQIRR